MDFTRCSVGKPIAALARPDVDRNGLRMPSSVAVDAAAAGGYLGAITLPPLVGVFLGR